MKILIGISGASGSIYGVRILEELRKYDDVETHLVVSDDGKKILRHETGYKYEDLVKKTDFCYENNDLFAAPASGSFKLDGVVVAPCSLKTLSSIANGYSDTLISRAACCALKEAGRKLVLLIRETPLSLPALENLIAAKRAGAVILPASPGFYHKPRGIDQLVDFIVGKVFDQLSLDHSLFSRWG